MMRSDFLSVIRLTLEPRHQNIVVEDNRSREDLKVFDGGHRHRQEEELHSMDGMIEDMMIG
jgi:hypothetical protein